MGTLQESQDGPICSAIGDGLITAVAFNCHGIKGDKLYIRKLVKKYDIVFLTEHWKQEFEKHEVDELEGATHDLVFTPATKTNSRGRSFGGEAFFIKKSLHHEIVQEFDFGLCISINLNGRKVYFCGVYMVFSSSENTIKYHEQLNYIAGLIQQFSFKDDFIIMGDLNSYPKNYPCPRSREAISTNCSSRALANFMNDFSLCAKYIDEEPPGLCHTYEKGGNKTYIDHILVPKTLFIPVQHCTILPTDCDHDSDHLAVLITLRCVPYGAQTSSIKKTSYKAGFWTTKENTSKYIDIQDRDTEKAISALRKDASPQEQLSIILSLLNDSAKVAAVSLTSHKRRKFNPWWTPELSELHAKKKCCYKQIQDSEHPSFSDKAQYKLVRNEYNRVVRKTKKAHAVKGWVNFDKIKHEKPKQFWKKLKSRNNPVPYAINGAKDKEESAKEAKDHFGGILTDKNDYTNDEYKIRVEKHLEDLNDDHDKLERIEITINHIRKAIKSLKTGKACGPDNIYSEMLTNCMNVDLLCIIAQFYSDILNTGDIPQTLGDARMIPLVKNPQKGYSDPNNYRPISLISILAKVFELIILQLCPFLQGSSMLQHGFKKNDSTGHAAYTVRTTIDHYIKSDHKVYACTLDAVKAFDLVSWVGLFSKLIEKMPPIIWLALYNYYKISSFFISYNGANSSTGEISCGVKQGGILSPYLYSFYLNDLLSSIQQSPFGTMIGNVYTGVVCYADDIFLLSRTAHGMQQMINFAYEYGKKWKITFNPNPGKSDIICFNAPKNGSHPRFFLGEDEIKMTTKLTHLGFLWDTEVKTLLSSHAQKKVNNFVSQSNHFIARGLQKAHPSTIAYIIKAQLLPLLYGMELGVFSDRQMNTWQAQINTALKGLFRCSRHCSNTLFACVGISKLNEYLDFKRSILENLISSNPYTQSILFYRMKNNTNNVCTADIPAILGSPRKMKPYPGGEEGVIDTLKTLIIDWNNSQARKQFRDILHSHLPNQELR